MIRPSCEEMIPIWLPGTDHAMKRCQTEGIVYHKKGKNIID